MSELTQVSVKSLGLDRASNTPVVILQERDGERVLPIWIGPAEASAIAYEMADTKFARPLTHDLLASVVGDHGGTLERVAISRVQENTYFSEMTIRRNGEVIAVDARPSDSIAVALRLQADIFVQDEMLEARKTTEPDDSQVDEKYSLSEALDPALVPTKEEVEAFYESLPEAVAAAFKEARSSMQRGLSTAVELTCRNILMHVAVEKNAASDLDLAGCLSHLEAEGYVTPDMSAGLEHFPDRAAHELIEPDFKRSRGTLRFTWELLRSVYVADAEQAEEAEEAE